MRVIADGCIKCGSCASRKKYDIVYCVRYNNVMLNKEVIYDKRKI